MKNNQINKDNKNNKRKAAIALLAGLAITGLIGASAASLGGIGGASLGADATDVASCDDTGVDVSYETVFVRDATITPPLDTDDQGYFDVDKVIVGGVLAACDLLTFEVVLLDDNNNTLGSATGPVTLVDTIPLVDDDNYFEVPMAGLVDAELVTGIAISISG